MSAFWALTRLRLLDVLRSRSSVGFVLIFPVVLLVVVGLVFADGHPFEQRTVIVIYDTGGGARTETALLADYQEVRLETSDSRDVAVLKLHAKMASAIVERGTVLVGPRDRLFGNGLAAALGQEVRVSVIDVPRFGYVHYLFPGVLAFSVMVSGLFATGHTLVVYRQNRFLKKLATTPLPKWVFAAALVSARSVLVLVQSLLVALAAVLFFGVPFTLTGALWVLVTSLLGVLAFMGIGFLLACVVKGEELVVDLVSAANVPMVFLSEMFFPLDSLPAPLTTIGAALPSTAIVRATRAALLYGDTSLATLGPHLLVLAVWTVLSFAISLKVFRWHS